MSGRRWMTADRPRPEGAEVEHRAAVARRRAWLSLLLFPVSLLGAFLVGEGLVDLLGYPSGGAESPPLWAVLVAAPPALLVFVVPGVLAVRFGRTAVRLGRPDGRVPAIIGAVIALGFVAQNVLVYLVQTVLG